LVVIFLWMISVLVIYEGIDIKIWNFIKAHLRKG
jgi:hypothetical protein